MLRVNRELLRRGTMPESQQTNANAMTETYMEISEDLRESSEWTQINSVTDLSKPIMRLGCYLLHKLERVDIVAHNGTGVKETIRRFLTYRVVGKETNDVIADKPTKREAMQFIMDYDYRDKRGKQDRKAQLRKQIAIILGDGKTLAKIKKEDEALKVNKTVKYSANPFDDEMYLRAAQQAPAPPQTATHISNEALNSLSRLVSPRRYHNYLVDNDEVS